jgi:apolipoprotein N-acyltransferase
VRGVAGIFVFSVIWTCVEYARGHLFTGFPWNLAGYSFAFSDTTLQLASLTGAYGLTWFAVLLGASFAAAGEKHGRIFIAASWALLAAGSLWGAARLHEADAVPPGERIVPGITLRLVQANISQPHKWDPQLQRAGLEEYIRLTQSPGIERITHVIWPETATPYVIASGSPLTQALGDAVPPGTLLITGGLRAEGDRQHWKIWNSLMALDHQGGIVGVYDKVKLVPFGEFLPFRSLLPASWLTPVGDTDFSSGIIKNSLDWPNLPPFRPLICYESIFPQLSASSGPQRPQWLLNVTNDAWFGLSTGPYQHFQMARMRAVEQGLPLVRVGNTGITAMIDPYGRIVASLALGNKGILDINLQKPLQGETTYGILGDIFLLLLIIFASALILSSKKTPED